MHHADSLGWPDPKCSICSMRYVTSTVSGVGSLRPLPVRHSTITGPPDNEQEALRESVWTGLSHYCAYPAHGSNVFLCVRCVSAALVELVFQERRLEVWRPVDFCRHSCSCSSLRSNQAAELPARLCGQLPEVPCLCSGPCSAVADTRQARTQMQISQFTGLIKEDNIHMHSALEPLQRCPWRA